MQLEVGFLAYASETSQSDNVQWKWEKQDFDLTVCVLLFEYPLTSRLKTIDADRYVCTVCGNSDEALQSNFRSGAF